MAPDRGEADIDHVVREEGDGLFRFLYWALGHREDALDALQETLIRVHRGLADLRERGSLRRWVYRIATNVAHDTRARRKRAPATFGLAADDGATVLLAGRAEAAPAQQLDAKETDARLALALAELPPELREPLLLHVVSGLKYREVAETLGWPIGTVTTRIHAARERLAERLGE